ncbi:hypothetical protein CTEN210_04613 [Chaetoceros tenuissimus]|uniref:Short/branched chain specific acyl-CoA dehydrogenase, mitochondrial n=1 Tax=Chaetoceros tenuissimus TaxID=426638 RepID=A0AAD3H2G2_9STRA|nr:hypothetical protein CTEN210_04613 [Chaetoceros tenuissimus]
MSSSAVDKFFPSPITLLTEDERMIKESVRKWAIKDLKPRLQEMETNECIYPSVIQKLFENGYMSMEINEKYGGIGTNFTSACIAIQEISRIDPSVALMVDVHNTLVVNMIRFWGSDYLKDKYLPKLAKDSVSSFCLSEANAGSDAFSMKTQAYRSSDNLFTINGTKSWITNAKEAEVLIVFCNVNPSEGYKGITAFVVDTDTEGVNIGVREKKLGLKASSTCQIVFDNVIVDASQMLGELGKGYEYCIKILNEGRIGIASQQIGIAKGCFDVVMPYLNEREQFGMKLADMPSLQQQYAQAATELYAAEVMMLNACRLKENGLPFVKEAAMSKLFASQVSEKICSQSIEWMGAVGYSTDYKVEKFFRDCKVGSIYEGSSNIQRQTIAKIMKSEYSH